MYLAGNQQRQPSNQVNIGQRESYQTSTPSGIVSVNTENGRAQPDDLVLSSGKPAGLTAPSTRKLVQEQDGLRASGGMMLMWLMLLSDF